MLSGILLIVLYYSFHVCGAAFDITSKLNATESLADAAQQNGPHLDARKALNPCDWVNAIPILYHNYTEPECPPILTYWNGKDCEAQDALPDPDGTIAECTAFCQLITEYSWGQEKPFVGVQFCRGGIECTIGDSHVLNYKYDLKLTFNWKPGPVTFGTSGGFDRGSKQAYSSSFKKSLSEGECGYFTFVPIIKTTYGTYTYGVATGLPARCHNEDMIDSRELIVFQTQVNWWDKNNWGNYGIQGITIFVYTDCVTLMPLDSDKQDPVYKIPGVPLDRPKQQAYADMWKNHDSLAATSEVPSGAYCSDDIAGASLLLSDCAEAVTLLDDNYDSFVAYEDVNGKFTFTNTASYSSCEIRVLYGSKWDGQCQIKFLEVSAAANKIIATCQAKKDGTGYIKQDNYVALRTNDNCYSSVKLAKAGAP